jgi:acylphosphatase
MVRKCKIQVSGKVQGVFFRKFTRETALSLGLSGWVRNMPDGSVLIEAQGTEAGLSRFMDWCKTGSPLCRVDSVRSQFMDAQEEFSGFEIRR